MQVEKTTEYKAMVEYGLMAINHPDYPHLNELVKRQFIAGCKNGMITDVLISLLSRLRTVVTQKKIGLNLPGFEGDFSKWYSLWITLMEFASKSAEEMKNLPDETCRELKYPKLKEGLAEFAKFTLQINTITSSI